MIFVTFILFVLISLTCVSAVDYNQIDNGTLKTNEGDFSDLFEEINATTGNELKLTKDYVYNSLNDTDYSNGIEITKDNFVIDGQGHTISGENEADILICGGNNIVLKNINFIKAFSITDGGAVYFRGNGTVENCNFSNNLAINGGALFFAGSGVVKNSTFIQNRADKDGGAIYFASGGVVENSNIFGNSALHAGGIYIADCGVVNYSKFILNTAAEDAGSILFNNKGNVSNCMFNYSQCGRYSRGGALLFKDEGIVKNTTFYYNIAEGYAGAINFEKKGSVEYSSFTKNVAKNSDGAIAFRAEGSLIGCNFTDNSAVSYCGAANFEGVGYVDSCNFNNNTGIRGGAIIFGDIGFINNSNFTNNVASQMYGGAISGFNRPLTIINSLFLDNKAKSGYIGYGGNFTFRFSGSENLFHAVHVQECNFSNIVYWNGDIVNSDNVTASMNTFPGINITLEVYNSNNVLLNNVTLQTDGNSLVYYNPYYLDDGNYTFKIYHLDDSYYFDSYLTTVPFTLKRSNVEINITDKAEFKYNDCNISFNALNSTIVNVIITDKNGKVLINKTTARNYISVNLNAYEDYYNITVSNEGNEYYAPGQDSKLFKILKQNASITAKNKSFVINYGGKYSVTLKDAKGKAISNQKVTFKLSGKSIGFAKTNAKGVATIKLTSKILKTAKAGKRNLIVKFDNSNYNIASKTVKITINKEKTKFTVNKQKTFKKSQKVKKYTIILKNSKGKAVNKVKVTLKVNGKIYKATTNYKGKAIFKINKLNKRGKFLATIKFAGNSCFKAVIQKVKIIVKM